ncbi:MAG TPA: dihydroneopterin aldolase [Brumimicrobium sp.]|nr:dihydroneopterin aldolase [Brumimicrobium sp.]
MNINSIPKLSTLRVENLRLRAYIGFIDWEKIKLQDVVISYSFKYNTSNAAISDDVVDAVNYKTLTKEIIQLVENQSFQLIEFLAEKIYAHIQSFSPNVQDIEVQVEKPNALRFSDNVLVHISSKDRYSTSVITLGSNIEPKENFEKALRLLQGLGIIVQRTDFIETTPLKFEDQPNFLNGAVLILTQKSLSELKLELKQIEAVIGRVRTENKNAPRKIDLDVTTYNDFLIDKDIDELPFIKDFVKFLRPDIKV